jgi:hypothetical protein
MAAQALKIYPSLFPTLLEINKAQGLQFCRDEKTRWKRQKTIVRSEVSHYQILRKGYLIDENIAGDCGLPPGQLSGNNTFFPKTFLRELGSGVWGFSTFYFRLTRAICSIQSLGRLRQSRAFIYYHQGHLDYTCNNPAKRVPGNAWDTQSF